MVDISVEDYIYIESIGLLIYYYDIPKKRQIEYANLYIEALKVATSRDNMSGDLLKELIAQEAIAFQIKDKTAIQPDAGMYNVLDTLFRYAGDLSINIIVNIDERTIKLMSTTIGKLLAILS